MSCAISRSDAHDRRRHCGPRTMGKRFSRIGARQKQANPFRARRGHGARCRARSRDRTRMIDAAIVGLGRWGKGFLESVQGKSRRIRFVRGVDTVPDVVRDLAARHGFKPSSDLAEALADPAVQALVLVTPHSLHRDQVVACALAGKHVFCEKPLALTRADAQIMIAACARAGVVLGVGHNRRLWPSMQALGRAVDGGELGQILHLEGHFSNEHSNKVSGGWRLSSEESPGGGMTGAGLHVLDAFIHLAGPVLRVHAQLLERRPAPAPLDTVSAIYGFAKTVSSGAGAGLRSSSCACTRSTGPARWMNASRTCSPAPVMPPPGDSSGESRQPPETLFECSLLKCPSRCSICPSSPPSTVRLSACIEGHQRRL